MRDRLVEFLPLLLVAVILVAFQLARSGVIHPPTVTDPTAVREPRPNPPTPAVLDATQRCNPTQPRFVGGLARLRAIVGPVMGDPLECEHVVAGGDTHQRTTTGLAYVRTKQGMPSFTTGWDHWALRDGSLIRWASAAVEPPE
jgi:hypothetical protein